MVAVIDVWDQAIHRTERLIAAKRRQKTGIIGRILSILMPSEVSSATSRPLIRADGVLPMIRLCHLSRWRTFLKMGSC